MQIIMISIFVSLIGAGIFDLGVKTVLLSVFVATFKILLGITFLGSALFAIRKVRG